VKKTARPKKKTVAVVVGTRPEAVKLAPVIRALGLSKKIKPLTINTCQHHEMVRQIFTDFGIRSDVELNVMRPRQTLWGLTARVSQTLGDFFTEHPVDAVLVQGDTTSAFVGGLCAFYHKIPVGHVESGLRSGDMYSPFPEELNRSMLGRLSTWHFAPTEHSRKLLLREAVEPSRIHMVGNTVVDAVHWITRRPQFRRKLAPHRPGDPRLVLITCHRRENLGEPMAAVSRAIRRLALRHADCHFLFPVHPNPAVREVVMPILKDIPNVELTSPMDYEDFLARLVRCHLVLSDSGGIQEEGTSLGKPVLLLRRETERPEGIHAGVVKMVGTDEERIYRNGHKLLSSQEAWSAMARGSKVFGDGKSSARIVSILEKALTKKA
jgi:UDP-N-acetylglucosamine 2-epimerase (non-hydrolysing)